MQARQSHSLILKLAILLLASFPIALFSQSVAVKLRNGDRITGVIISEKTDRVVLSNAWSKDISIPLAEIQSRETVAPPVAAVTNEPTATTNPPIVAAYPPPPPAKPVATTKSPAKKAPTAWHGDVAVGMDVGFSEKNRQLYHGRFKVIYAPASDANDGTTKYIDRFRNTFDFNTAYGTTDGELSANRMDGSSKTDFDLGSERAFFVYNLFGGGYDEIRRIEKRFEFGPGAGYHILKRTNLVLNAEAGLNYQTQQLWSKAGGSRVYTWNDRFFYRFAQDFSWGISKTLTFDEKFELYPEMNFDNFRFRFESNLRYWLLENLSLNLSVIDIYDTEPARDVGRNDLQIRSSIGVKF